MTGDIRLVTPGLRLAGTVLPVLAAKATTWRSTAPSTTANPAMCWPSTPTAIPAAVFGDILGDICVAKGIAGFVIDGATRDVDELTAMKLPVFAAAVTPAGPWKDGPGTTGYAVSCGHVVCHRCRTC